MKNLMIASSDQEKLSSWKQGLNGFVNLVLVKDKLLSNKLNVLSEEISRTKPGVLLLDFELFGLGGSYSVASLKRLSAETRIIVLGKDVSEDTQWELLKAGMRGCCNYNIRHEMLNQVVDAVIKGELWIPRTLTSRLIDELGNHSSMKSNASRATWSLLSKLTQREYDIAVRVGKGECNKQIALACNITERTVKAHLTEIFQKMGVSDRLNLALVLASDTSLMSDHAYGGQLSSPYAHAAIPKLRSVAI